MSSEWHNKQDCQVHNHNDLCGYNMRRYCINVCQVANNVISNNDLSFVWNAVIFLILWYHELGISSNQIDFPHLKAYHSDILHVLF